MPFVTRLAGSADVAKIEMDAGRAHAAADRDRNPGAGARARRLRRDRRPLPLAAHADGAGRDREDACAMPRAPCVHRPLTCRARSRGRCRPAMAVRPADRSRVLHVLRAAATSPRSRAIAIVEKSLSPGGRHPRRRARDRKPGRLTGGRQAVARRMDAAKQASHAAVSRRATRLIVAGRSSTVLGSTTRAGSCALDRIC